MRKILTNPNIKSLFLQLLAVILSFELGAVALLVLKPEFTALLLCLPVLMGVVMLFCCCQFFRKQEQMIG